MTVAPKGPKGFRKSGSNTNYKYKRNSHGKTIVTKTNHEWSRTKRGKRYHTQTTDRYVAGDEAAKRRFRPSKEQQIQENNFETKSDINHVESNGNVDEAREDQPLQEPTDTDTNQDVKATPADETNSDQRMQAEQKEESDENQDAIPVDETTNDQQIQGEATEEEDSDENQDATAADNANNDQPMPHQEEQPNSDATQEVYSGPDEDASSDEYMPDMEQRAEERDYGVRRDMYNVPA